MSSLVTIAARTPVWVWPLLAYLVWSGIRSLEPRTSSLARLLVVPAVFSADGVLLLRSLDGAVGAALWLTAVLAALPLGFSFGPRILRLDRVGRTVALGGSAVPLVRNLALFALQYGVAVGMAVHPRHCASWALAGTVLSGLSLGYFAGWLAALARAWRDARMDA